MSRRVRSGTAGRQAIRYRVWGGECFAHTESHMLFIFGVVIVLITVGSLRRMRVPGGVSASTLGRMSEQWLAEYRASHAA
jgi:hypothetical protein